MTDFELIFESAGGITLLAAGKHRTYSDPKVVAWDVSGLMNGNGISLSERALPPIDDAKRRLTSTQVLTAVAWHSADSSGWLERIPLATERQFFSALFDLRSTRQILH